MKVFVPGNLLLLGEYAITAPGGKGIAIAVDSYVKIESTPAKHFSITCTFEGKQHQWIDGSPFQNELSLIEHVVEGARNHLTKKSIPLLDFTKHIIIDSSHFSYENGRKKGFGSSAAVTAGLTYLLLRETYSQTPDLIKEVFPLALSIHKKFQGGRGSGYDIATSLFGGAGIFTGGTIPTWKPITQSWMNSLFLVRGDEESSSKNAVARFNHFKDQNLTEATQFLKNSNSLVSEMATCTDFSFAKELFEKGSALNYWINEKLDISSIGPRLNRLLQSYQSRGYPGKPLGAGGEIAAILLDPDAKISQNQDKSIEPLKISTRGLWCEQ